MALELSLLIQMSTILYYAVLGALMPWGIILAHLRLTFHYLHLNNLSVLTLVGNQWLVVATNICAFVTVPIVFPQLNS